MVIMQQLCNTEIMFPCNQTAKLNFCKELQLVYILY